MAEIVLPLIGLGVLYVFSNKYVLLINKLILKFELRKF